MVWQVPDNDIPADNQNSDPSPPSLTSLPLSISSSSYRSSSVELGPTPGSGMALDSLSLADSESETIQSEPKIDSSRNSMVDLDNASPLRWSADVESMLNNPPPSKFESFNLSGDPSLSSWVVPLDTRMPFQDPIGVRELTVSMPVIGQLPPFSLSYWWKLSILHP